MPEFQLASEFKMTGTNPKRWHACRKLSKTASPTRP